MNGEILLKIGCHNVEGLSKKLCEDDYVDFIHKHDIFCLQETFTHDNFDFSLLFNEYEHFHKPGVKLKEKGRRSGGIVVLIKKTIAKYVEPIDCEAENMICVKVDGRILQTDGDAIMIFTYIHPCQSPFYDDKGYDSTLIYLEEFLMQLTEQYVDIPYMIVGDLNSRIGDWNLTQDDEEEPHNSGITETYGNRKSRDKITNIFGRQLISLCELCQLVPLNGNTMGDLEGKFTFVSNHGKSVIDYALVSLDMFLQKTCCFHILSNVESLHAPIYIPIYGAYLQNDNLLSQNQKTVKKTSILKWDNEKEDRFYSEMENHALEIKKAENMIELRPDDAVKLFTETIMSAASCMRRTVYIRTGRKKVKNDWYDIDCTMAKQNAKEAKCDYDTAQDDKTKEVLYFQLRAKYKDTTRDKKRSARRDKVRKLIRVKKDGKRFWSTIKDLRPNPKSLPEIDMNEWKKHFERVFDCKDICQGDKPSGTDRKKEPVTVENLDKDITIDEVSESIRSLKSGKASGIDEVCGEFIKSSHDFVLPFLTKLFNHIYKNSYYPLQWCKAVIIPILKKGNNKNPDNYRGISLLSVISKTFTSIINKRLYEWCEKEDKISFEQAAFRKSFSTTDHIFTLTTIIQNRLYRKDGGKVYACFIDYHKAYDHINRQSLWDVLYDTGVSSMMLSMFKAMYKTVLSCVRWNGTLSEMFECPSGLRQGCLCSPLAFALLIGKVADFVRRNGKHGFQLIPGGPEIYQLLFADDIILISSTPHGLQTQINNLESASKSLGLTVNMEKTKIMVFRRGGFLGKNEKWFYKKQQLETVDSYKYLGFTLTPKLSDTKACEDFAKRAKMKIFEILKTMWALGSLNTVIFFQLFDAQVKPMLLYAAEIWGWKEVDVVESAHLFACKKIMSVSNKTPNHMTYGETGRHPLHIDAKIATVRYWLKVMKMPNHRLPKQALLSMMTIHERDENDKRVGWYTAVKRCLADNGFMKIWEDRGTADEKAFLRKLKDKLVFNFQQSWLHKMESSERFSFYKTFKKVFLAELYLNDITVKKFRDALIQFRLGLNNLKVNRRFERANLDKKCDFCEDLLEDEQHFLLQCPKYDPIREKYLNSYFNLDVITVAELLETLDLICIRQLAMYIYYGLEMRKACIKK